MISIVIPIFNEETILPELINRLTPVINQCGEEAEVICVDDGSSDGTYPAMKRQNALDPRFKLIRLSRNFGHQVAISAGMDHARGDAVVLMDGDLQDPPELIPRLVEQWRKGYEVVYTVKKSRKENPLKRAAFTMFYRILHTVSTINIPMDAGNFSLMDRRVIDVFRAMPERNRYISGMRAWTGFSQIGVEFDREARFAGKPQMSLFKLIRLALDGIFSFSSAPLRLAIYLGVLSALTAFVGAGYVMYAKLFTDRAILGWTSTIVSILLVGGMILTTLGVIGEYISRIYEEVKSRPLYVVRDKLGL